VHQCKNPHNICTENTILISKAFFAASGPVSPQVRARVLRGKTRQDSRRGASARRPWSRRSRARAHAARNSNSSADCERAIASARPNSLSARPISSGRFRSRRMEPTRRCSSASYQASPVRAEIHSDPRPEPEQHLRCPRLAGSPRASAPHHPPGAEPPPGRGDAGLADRNPLPKRQSLHPTSIQ
jgi:hypothetical protein